MPRGWPTWLLLGCSVLFIFVCLVSLGNPRPIVFPGDSSWFQVIAAQPLTSGEFWFATRAWGYPALLKLTGTDEGSVLFVQFVLHISSHLFLAWALFLSMARGRLALSLGIAVLAFAISPHLTSWTVVLLSESLAISVTAVVLGLLCLLLSWIRGALPSTLGKPLAVAIALGGFLLGGTRDNWPYFLVLVAAGLLLVSELRTAARAAAEKRTLLRVVAAFLVIAALFQIASARFGQRWRFGLTNVVLMKVMPDPQARDRWARTYGLPVDPELTRIAREYRPGHMDDAFAHAPFQRWLGERGMKSYTRELLGHPIRTTGAVLDGHRETRDFFSWEYSEFQGDRTLAARLSKRLLFGPMWLPPGLDFVAVVVPLLLVVLLGPRAWQPAVFPFLALGFYLPFMAALGLLADVEEIYRHTLQVSLSLRLLRWLGAIWLIALAVHAYKTKTGFENRSSPA